MSAARDAAGELDVLFVDNHLLVVAKPAGLATVPDASGDESLFARAERWVASAFAKPGRAWLGVVHRLDRPVSGVCVLARTSKAATRLSEELRRRELAKTYWAVCPGEPPAPEGRLEQWLVKDTARNVVSAVDEGTPGAKRALTRWRVLAREGERVLVELVPETGRAHQLRVAAASWGRPLLGDLKYGAERPLADRSVALHSRALELTHPVRRERLRFEAPPPARPWWRFPGAPR